MKTLDQLEKEFKEKFGKQSVFDKNKKDIEKVRTMWSEATEKLKNSQPEKSRFVQTEFSRFKITMLKNNSIIINELKEDEANRLFDNIENAC